MFVHKPIFALSDKILNRIAARKSERARGLTHTQIFFLLNLFWSHFHSFSILQHLAKSPQFHYIVFAYPLAHSWHSFFAIQFSYARTVLSLSLSPHSPHFYTVDRFPMNELWALLIVNGWDHQNSEFRKSSLEIYYNWNLCFVECIQIRFYTQQ